MKSDFAPLINEFVQAVVDVSKSPTIAHQDARMKGTLKIRNEIVKAKNDMLEKMVDADVWFHAYIDKEESDLPKVYNQNSNTYVEWLQEYEVLCSCLTLGNALLWNTI